MDGLPESKKRGRGRPPGSHSKITLASTARALATGLLPHEFLLAVARGDLITQKRINRDTGLVEEIPVYPDLATRIDAAKAAAPYYAPKISTVELIHGVADHELDDIIQRAAAEAGVSLSLGGEGEEDEEEEGSGSAAPVGAFGQQLSYLRRRSITGPQS